MKSKPALLATLGIKTAEGVFAAHYSAAGLARLEFPKRGRQETPAASPSLRRWHKLAGRAVWRVLQGRAAGRLPPLDLAGGTPFQRKVWAALRRIGAGETETYGQLAAALGRPKAARAVGSACAANPAPLLIPCHRVVASGGGLGGFSGGLEWKRKLLARECLVWNGGNQSARAPTGTREGACAYSPRNGLCPA
jgi:O-6-methylguanine DNA methyltransferase